MNRYGYAISLRIWHPSIDPAELTIRLGRTAERAWQAGEPRANARGEPLQGTYAQSFWTVGLVSDPPSRDA